MKKLLVFLGFLLAAALPAEAQFSGDKYTHPGGFKSSFINTAQDTDIDTAFEVIVDASFAQISAADQIEILSAQAADTGQQVTIVGMGPDSARVSQTLDLNGTSVVTSTVVFEFVEYAYINTGGEATGAITLRKEGVVASVAIIAAGELSTGGAHYFAGRTNRSFITGFRVMSIDGAGVVNVELRIYPDHQDAVDLGDGYFIVAEGYIAATAGAEFDFIFPIPYALPRYAYATVQATSAVANTDLRGTLYGYAD